MIFETRSSKKRMILILETETGAVETLEGCFKPKGRIIDGVPHLLLKEEKKKSKKVKIINLNTKEQRSIIIENDNKVCIIKWQKDSILMLCREYRAKDYSIFSWNGESKF